MNKKRELTDYEIDYVIKRLLASEQLPEIVRMLNDYVIDKLKSQQRTGQSN